MSTMPEIPQAAWEEAEQKDAFWQAHAEEFAKRYPEQFVAVKGRTVLATNSDLVGLEEHVKKLGLELGDVWVFYFGEPAPHVL